MKHMNRTDVNESLRTRRVEIAARLRSMRISRKWTQANLARSIGVSPQQMQKYESGTDRVPSDRMMLIAEMLECDVSELISGAPVSVDNAQMPEGAEVQKSRLLIDLAMISDPKLLRVIHDIINLHPTTH